MGYYTDYYLELKDLDNQNLLWGSVREKIATFILNGYESAAYALGIMKETESTEGLDPNGYQIQTIRTYGNLCNEGLSTKWYEHEEEMRVISIQFPDVLFELHGEGEESGDTWIKYFADGKMQRVDAVVTFEEFDKGRLE